ncbi:hypothetical protein [Rhodococcus sp. 1139]|nr:hypothetical protein [Rhodococcus sp. 1139]
MRNVVVWLQNRLGDRVDLSSDRSVMTPEAALVLASIFAAIGVVWWAA